MCNNAFKMEFNDLDNFTNHMCLYCFDTMTGGSEPWNNHLDILRWNLKVTNGNRIQTSNNTIIELDYHHLKSLYNANLHEDDILLKQFSSKFYLDTFINCCDDARRCCEDMNKHEDAKGNCPMLWDGWTCWRSSPPGIAQQTCTDMTQFPFGYQPAECLRSKMTFQCNNDGTWHEIMNPYYGRWMPRTDHKQCTYLGRDARLTYSTIRLVLESISLACTTIGLILFVAYRLYTQFRLQIHVNFFLSIMLSAIMNILYEWFVPRAHLYGTNMEIMNNPKACKAFTFMFKDLNLIKYVWMLIEGFNFHHMVVFTFNDLRRYKIPIYLFGWIVPHVLMLAYMLVRFHIDDDDCWTNSIDYYEFIYITPNYLCFAINLALFINLVRVVVVKLWLSNNNLYNHYMKRHHFVKTALILMPIFGLQYFIHIIPPGDPTETCDNIQIGLLYLQLIIESAQGILVTITLCFLNKEVYSCVRKSISSMESNTILTSNTISSETSK